ncbi:hypothetical protein RSOLAG1IB_08118 [Rhizoctonia solani AG-1 IB]|uniref:GPI mannosyltransferase 2 n=1 Tax=Thanatephorus cucumeris (strain AG1-IB / isolate 7/3/14) TaxID=1108050 RepID=A0A0B7FGR5_THACB|nr:hypothetical protein RSOLAG1IB_08118 [Rhizoctonia solani AG-1 IB]
MKKHDVIFSKLVQDIEDSESSELNPLLHVLRQEIPKEESEFHAWFSSMFKSILQHTNFEKIFDDDVPNSVKDLLREYARSTDENIFNRETSAALASQAVVQSFGSALSKFGARLLQLATCNSVHRKPRSSPPSLPPSPHFHHLATFLARNIESFPDILEGDGKPMDRVRPGTKFENWGRTVENSPDYTFVARTEIGLCNLVKWAAGVKKKVRVAGYRHTWSDFYSSDNQVLVMLLPIQVLTDLPSYSPSMEEIQKHCDLVGIEVTSTESKGALCTVKAGTTNEMFREWCLQNRRWCLPFNVIMVEITMGGSNAPICHGAGLGALICQTIAPIIPAFDTSHLVPPKDGFDLPGSRMSLDFNRASQDAGNHMSSSDYSPELVPSAGLRWDTLHYLDVALSGTYTYEHQHAFSPGVPIVLRLVHIGKEFLLSLAPRLPLIGYTNTQLHGYLANLINTFLVAMLAAQPSLALYNLTKTITHSKEFSFLTLLVHVILGAPPVIIRSAYGEPFFAWLTFEGSMRDSVPA